MMRKPNLPNWLSVLLAVKHLLISKGGRPMVKVIPFDTTIGHPQRLGFMAGEISVPEDFDSMGSSEIAALFIGGVS